MSLTGSGPRSLDSHVEPTISEPGAELRRLREVRDRSANWQRWGPYLSERQWGTVREDYSADGDSWGYLPHDHARSRAYRWGEDGLLGICDRQCRLCFALALWNGRDPILKERLFGLTGPEGNHGEDVKECYYYLDSTPTHSYMRALYKYPQHEFPYARLIEENRSRGRLEPEFELADTGIFDQEEYFDVFVEYAKAGPNDVLILVTIHNRGSEEALIHCLPTLWFRNTWSWGCTHEGCDVKPRIAVIPAGAPTWNATRAEDTAASGGTPLDPPYVEAVARHSSLGTFRFWAEASPSGALPVALFTDNETNVERLFGAPSGASKVKDAFHEYVVHGNTAAVNPRHFGTKLAMHYHMAVPARSSVTLRLRLASEEEASATPLGAGFQQVMEGRRREADEFYRDHVLGGLPLTGEPQRVARQAFAGLLWSKQFYHYVVKNWLEGDPNLPPPPDSRKNGRNRDWPHLFNRDVISMPDKWEYPWYAAWDLAFHMIPMAAVDAEFAKAQLELFLREWYMHPNGQIPAYEFQFSDVNPPVHAWACWRVYKMTGPRGARDRRFLASVFTKLLLNFTWWVNRKDVEGRHLFSGGFLGLDNIGVFDRSKPLPGGGYLEQADGTAWMAFYCATMLAMALELAQEDSTYEDIASKFFEHFVHIVDAMNSLGGLGLWSETDGFYYDQLRVQGNSIPLGIRSIVGVIPLFAVEILDEETLRGLPGFRKRMEWFLRYRPDLGRHISYCEEDSRPSEAPYHRLLAIPSRQRLVRVLRYVLDEQEFLSPFGIRALSRYHLQHPYIFRADGQEYCVEYVAGDSNSAIFGGNSNWRGPIWFPINYLLIEALERYHHFFGDTVRVECPTGSGMWMNLQQVARELSQRLRRIFLPDASGQRPCHGSDLRYAHDPQWRDLVLFHEYFHGDTGRGIGASHQTGWTALVASLVRGDR